MTTTEYRREMYPMLCEWWQGHKWDAVPDVFLPACGYIVLDDDKGEPAAAGFIYIDPTALMGQMEWIVTRPGLAPRRALEALNTLVGRLSEEADEFGLALFSSIQSESLFRLYERHGFSEAERSAINVIRLPRKKEG